MWVIRDVLTLAVVFLVLLFGVVMHVIVWIIEKISGSRPTKLISGYVRGGMKLAWLMTGAKATVIGTENIPTDRAALFVGNHRSLLDVILAGSLIPVPVGFIAKIELEKIPLLGFLMTDIDCLFLDRTIHNPVPQERLQMMPVQKAFPLNEVLALLRHYDWSGQRRLSFEYTMFRGLNDDLAHATRLVETLRGLAGAAFQR